MFKKFISMILTISLLIVYSAPSNAQDLNTKSFGKNLHFIEQSNDKNIYTFTKDNKKYKYVDFIISDKKVITEKYLYSHGKYNFLDTTTYTLNNDVFTIYSNTNNTKEILNINSLKYNLNKEIHETKGYKWKRTEKYDGDTSIKNMSVTAIAILLGGIVGGGTGAVMAVAAYLFDKNIKTVYYKVYVYKDENSSRLRPTFKYVTYWYEDKKHKKPTKPKKTTNIVRTGGTN